jgi:uncharacterized cupin superfamily protein
VLWAADQWDSEISWSLLDADGNPLITGAYTKTMLRSLCSHLDPTALHPATGANAAAAAAAAVPLASNGAPRRINADRTLFGRAGGAHQGPESPELEFMAAFQGTTPSAPFALGSPFAFVHTCIIPPGGGIGLHSHTNCEEIFVTIDNASQFTHNERTTQVHGGAAVPIRRGEVHGIYNNTDRETRWFNFNVNIFRDQKTHGQNADATDIGEKGTQRAHRVGVPLVGPEQLPSVHPPSL